MNFRHVNFQLLLQLHCPNPALCLPIAPEVTELTNCSAIAAYGKKIFAKKFPKIFLLKTLNPLTNWTLVVLKKIQGFSYTLYTNPHYCSGPRRYGLNLKLYKEDFMQVKHVWYIRFSQEICTCVYIFLYIPPNFYYTSFQPWRGMQSVIWTDLNFLLCEDTSCRV